jgi:hypothetical protein
MNTLSALLNNDQRFRMIAERYIQESCTVTTDNIDDDGHHHSTTDDEKFKKIMDSLPIVTISDGQVDHLHNYYENGLYFINLVQVMRTIPAERQAVIISNIMNVVNVKAGKGSFIAVKTSKILADAQAMATTPPVVIVTVQLAWKAVESISSWWKEDISGKRCVKQIIDTSAGVLGSYAGGAAGSTIGTVISPGYGTLVGAVVGGIAGSCGASTLSGWLTEHFFDLPKSVALENAYKFLNLLPSCSNTEINGRYKTLALQYHPDRGGKAEDFHKLQVSVAIIKQARGQGV